MRSIEERFWGVSGDGHIDQESHLVYRSFTVSHHELLHTQMRLRIDKKALSHGVQL